MHAYRTHIVIADPDRTVLIGLPFQIGQRVEVVLLEEFEQATQDNVTRHILEQEWLHGRSR